MQAKLRGLCAIFLSRRLMHTTTALVLLSVFSFAQTGSAQTTPPLNFGNNYFVTGDYVVGGVGLRGLGVNGFATGTINIPDANSVPATGVPPGAEIVAAWLYWTTVESSQTTFVGKQGFFGVYPITGEVLGNPNAPVSWSSGGCSGNSQGSKTMRSYRADVLALLPVDSNGIVQPNNSYQVRLADSGSAGGGAPLTLGATLVIIYRVLSPDFPLNAVLIYEGAYSPANGSSAMMQTMQGFYQAAASPIAKLTHIVGNGQDNKFEIVSLNGVILPSLYGSLPPFPGYYNGSWDNPTWIVNNYGPAVSEDASSVAASVVPAASNSGCVSWGAMIFSTRVKDTEPGGGDGLLNVWEQNLGYCDASVNEGVCSTTDPSWVALLGADPTRKDLFVQLDYMCSIVNPDGTCDPSGHSHLPPPAALTMMTSAFAPQGITLHLMPTNAIPEETCTDSTPSCGNPVLTPFPNQSGVVGWKGGFVFLKNEPININPATGVTYTEAECEQNPATCVRRFQSGKKDSYHYTIFGHSLGVANWNFTSETLTSVVASGNTVTFNTSTPHRLVAGDTVNGNGRVTVSDAITNPSLNGTYYVQDCPSPSPTCFTIHIADATNATYTLSTDPDLSVASGQTTTGSGFSDIGGADSLVTLGLWGADGQTVPVQAGTFMHELGHSIGLTHGGFFFFGAPGSYVPTVEANCKPNFQSVMNYLFVVDLLDGVLDYSGQVLNLLDEQALSGITGLTPATTYSLTRWYRPKLPGDVGDAATRHCDGTPKLLTDPDTIRVEGPTNSITWSSPQAIPQDINFDGTTNTNHRGYDDWANVDLRQIGATASDAAGGPLGKGGGPLGKGGGPLGKGGGPLGKGGGPLGKGGGVELTYEAANSVTRPPRNLTASLTPPPRYIQLNWMAPTFGQIGYYNVYRSTDGAAAVQISTPGAVTSLTFTDRNVTCGPTYRYFVTAVLFGTTQESVPSNTTPPITACAPPYIFTGFYSPMATADPPNTGSYSGTFNKSKSITAKWTLKDSSGSLVTDVNVNTLRAIGPFNALPNGTCPSTQASGGTTLLYSPTGGAKGNSTLRFSTSQFVFNWDTKATPPSPTLGPCYVLELSLDSGQVFKTGVKLQ